MLTIRPATVADLEHAPNRDALLDAYSRESRIDGMPENRANWRTYHHLEDVGALHVLGAFEEEEMVGFLFLLLAELPHYAGVLTATSESFFVLPEHRAGGTGVKLLRAAEALAREHGAECLVVSAPAGSRLDAFLAGLGRYRIADHIYFQRLT